MSETVFSVHPTPIGEALIVVSDQGLVALQVLDGPDDDALLELGHALGTFPSPDTEATASVAAQLDEYFTGVRRRFDLDLDWRLARGFTRVALEAVCEIPYGETASYGEIAITAGAPRAHRAVGTACARTPMSIVVPAHRVVRADGSIGQYGGRPEHKRFLLDLEARGVADAADE